MPALFIYSIAISSAFVLGGSILVGPEASLPKAAGAPEQMTALCRSPVLSLVHAQADKFLPGFSTLSFVGTNYLWDHVAGPPLALCEDVVVSENDRIQKNLEMGMNLSQASFVEPRARAQNWAFAAALPTPGSTITTINLPPLVFALHDGKRMGVPNVAVSASVHAFYDGDTDASTSAPVLVEASSTNATDAAGVANLRLQVDTAKCGAGELVVKVESMGLERFASVQLYWPPTSNSSFVLTSTASENLDDFTVVTADTTVHVYATVTTRTQHTEVNRTTYIYADSNHTALLNQTSEQTTIPAVNDTRHMLLLVQPPPTTIGIREPFNVSLLVVTQDGLAVPGVEVSVTLVTLKSTNTILGGVLRGYTDSSGGVTLNLHYAAGTTHTHSLLFSADTVIAALMEPSSQTAVLADLSRRAEEKAKKLLQDILLPLQGAKDALMGEVTVAVEAQLLAGADQLARDAVQRCTSGLLTASGALIAPGEISVADALAAPETLASCLETPMSLETGMDEIFKIMEPLVTKAVLSTMSSALLVDQLVDGSSLPKNTEELRQAAGTVGEAIWAMLPLPKPRLVRLINPLDSDGESGARITAPVYGYALSESSAETSQATGMSTCTLEGYARYEPSPRAFDSSVPVTLGVLTWPFRTVPRKWTSTLARYVNMHTDAAGRDLYDMDETEAYVTSALFQPWPFRNFNFLIDDDLRSDNSYSLENCRKTYVTLKSSFPYRSDPKLDSSCRQQCAMNIPDYSTNLFYSQPSTAACPREFVKSLGVDAMPGLDISAYGGIATLALHLECVGCYAGAQYKSCDVHRALVRNGGLGKSQLANASAHAFSFELTPEICNQWSLEPTLSIGEVYENILTTTSPDLLASRSAAVAWLKNLSHQVDPAFGRSRESVWNPCMSMRWQEPHELQATITEFHPDPKIRMRMKVRASALFCSLLAPQFTPAAPAPFASI